MFPIDRYKFYVAKRADGTPYKVVAISTYAGKKVKGTSTCSANDDFDLTKGKKLAAARCNAKVTEKRRLRAIKQMEEAVEALDLAFRRYEEMRDYSLRAEKDYWEAQMYLNDMLDDLQ